MLHRPEGGAEVAHQLLHPVAGRVRHKKEESGWGLNNYQYVLRSDAAIVNDFVDDSSIRTKSLPYALQAVILHDGPGTDSGHYRIMLRTDGGFCLKDDAMQPAQLNHEEAQTVAGRCSYIALYQLQKAV